MNCTPVSAAPSNAPQTSGPTLTHTPADRPARSSMAPAITSTPGTKKPTSPTVRKIRENCGFGLR